MGRGAKNIYIILPLALALLLANGVWGQLKNAGGPKTELFTEGYPRAFFFRQSESLTKLGYDDWNKTFNRLGGIIGKCLNEEIPERDTNIPFFTQFKLEHPGQLVMLHYNGNGRDPRDNGYKFYAGHWLYFEGVKNRSEIKEEEGICEIEVEDAGIFKTKIGRYENANEDIGICRLTEDGKPDWDYSEQVQLVSVNLKKNTIKVRRAQYGSGAKQFDAGLALVSPHVTEGPWGENNNIMWLYNHSTYCPKDKYGKTCDDILVEELVERLSSNGELACFDGVEFDVLWNEVNHATFGRKVDTNADGKGDNGIINGVNEYSAGVFNFCKQLREKIGPEKLIMADGMTSQFQRGINYLNGIESEGWPIHRDPEIKDWSGGWNRHLFWNQNAFQPAFSFINFKYIKNTELPPEGRQRLVWAVAQLLDARITHSGYTIKRPEDGIHRSIIDEFVAGGRQQKYWLGKPLGETVRIALQQNDLLKGNGTKLTDEFLKKFSGDNAIFGKDGNSIKISARNNENCVFSINKIPCDGPDLLVSVKLKCDPRRGYPEEMPRLLNVSESNNPYKLMSFVNGDWFHATFYFRDVQEKTIDLNFEMESNEPFWMKEFTVHAYPDVAYRKFENGLVLVNPSHHNYTFNISEIGGENPYYHLQATLGQDTKVNNGQKVGKTLTLQEREGMFLETKTYTK